MCTAQLSLAFLGSTGIVVPSSLRRRCAGSK
uniref:Uncharacterized protein n=1 Tax=Anguilla anguilla TaxID=7936 RepID=A0A0E9SGA6_ANGAN